MAVIDASSKNDLILLAACFFSTPYEERWKLLAKIYDLGLMKSPFVLRLIEKIKGKIGIYQFFKILSQIHKKSIDNSIEAVILHIVKGRDTEDSTSIGGWSQREIDLLLDNVTFSLLRHKVEKTEENK